MRSQVELVIAVYSAISSSPCEAFIELKTRYMGYDVDECRKLPCN